MAEQMAPLLPGFDYTPADAKFLGDPIDYVVFQGLTDARDGDGSYADLEVVLFDVKYGKSNLSEAHRAIAEAIPSAGEEPTVGYSRAEVEWCARGDLVRGHSD